MVDLDDLLADLRAGEALLAKRGAEREPAGDHILGNDWIAGLHRERLAQLVGFRSRRFEAGERDRREPVLLPWLGIEDDPKHVARLFGARFDDRIIIALAAQPPSDSLEDAAGQITITSPIVGTFYRSPSPDADPYVEEGDYVKKGQVLCIVEAMKLMNEIESEVDGRITKILVESTKPVEYGQALFLIDPKATP